jgi:hypothetical protein
MEGMPKDFPGIQWSVVPSSGGETMLPAGRLRIEALSGLETALAQQEIEVGPNSPKEVTIRLGSVFRPEDSNLVAGNTHLHLKNFSLEKADAYLRQIPAADGLRVLFISYLERHKDDEQYITNRYPIGPLAKFGDTGVLVSNGEEHRHNFQGFGEGYGHVMFLDIKELVKPVSLGPGITGAGFDDLALRGGIDNARKQGGTILWCHNTFGFEDVPNAITGRLDALNVFDGSRAGKFEHNYYQYLNVGMRLPISTGTDWFLYDLARVYAEVRGKLTIRSWLDALKAGRNQITNGPLLTLEVDGHRSGDVIDLKEPKKIRIQASAVGRHPLERLELIRNGRVVKTATAERGTPTRIRLTHELRVDEPAWFAVRIDGKTRNEFDKVLFAHTSPVYVTYQGRGVFEFEAARELLRQVEEGQGMIKARGTFSSPEAASKLLALYADAARDLQRRIEAQR